LGAKGPLGLALNNLGYNYHLRSDYVRAIQTLQEGLSIVAQTGDTRVESSLLWSQGELMRDLDLVEGDESDFTTALSVLPPGAEPGLRSAILISAATLRRWHGKYEQAIVLAEEALSIAQSHNLKGNVATACVAQSAAQAHLGWQREALDEIDDAIAVLRAIEAPTDLMTALAIKADVAKLNGDDPATQDAFRDAIRVSNQIQAAQPLAAEIDHNPNLESLRYLISPTDVVHTDLLRLAEARRSLSSQSSVYGGLLSTEPYSLSVYTLGNERIERDGIAIPSSEWRAATARELFLYLLFMGPHSRESIGLTFWPDNSGDSVRNNFHTTLHRARQALGKEVVSFNNDLYGINPDLDVWCDALEMDNLVEQARMFAPHEARTEDLWRRAVKLYQGEFLPSLDTEWVHQRRLHYEECYMDALLGLAQCSFAREDHHNAIKHFQAALALDPYRENAHRGLMRCYSELGQNAQVAHQLDSLKRLLEEDLGIMPAPETFALAQSLLSLTD
jgi:DNA-binding SARP family transcriptional activator